MPETKALLAAFMVAGHLSGAVPAAADTYIVPACLADGTLIEIPFRTPVFSPATEWTVENLAQLRNFVPVYIENTLKPGVERESLTRGYDMVLNGSYNPFASLLPLIENFRTAIAQETGLIVEPAFIPDARMFAAHGELSRACASNMM